MNKVKNWFSENKGWVSRAIIGFCVGTTVTFWTAIIVGALKGLRLVWICLR